VKEKGFVRGLSPFWEACSLSYFETLTMEEANTPMTFQHFAEEHHILLLLTNSMEPSPSGEAISRSANQLPNIL
jgi:hypothetical protein